MIAVLAAGVSPELVQKRSEFIFYDEKQPYMEQWHANVDRDLGHQMVAEIGYLGSKGHNLPFYGDPNNVPSAYGADGVKRLVPGATLRYPSWGRIRTRINEARSIYHGLTASWNKRYSHNWQAQASYTYGNSHDTWSGGQIGGSDFDNGAGSATDWWDPEAEYGPSSFDIRHTLVLNGVYVLPFGQSATGFVGALIRRVADRRRRAVLERPAVHAVRVLRSDRRPPERHRPPEAERQRSGDYPGTAAQWFDPSVFSVPAAGVFGNASPELAPRRRASRWRTCRCSRT